MTNKAFFKLGSRVSKSIAIDFSLDKSGKDFGVVQSPF